MKLIKRQDIRWDIVKETGWLAKLGWPITVYKTNIEGWIQTGKHDDRIPFLDLRNPFEKPFIVWGNIFDEDSNVLPKGQWKPVIRYRAFRVNWNGWLWFWRD